MLIYKKESDADIKAQADFILSCTQITSDILTIPNCPWTVHSNPVRYWIANDQDRLGELQIRIIKFLHRNYFQYGKPVYLKSRSIAERLGESIPNILRAIASLVKRGILVRLHFIMDSNNRSMLIPGTVEFKDFVSKTHVTPPSSVFFRKLQKKLQKSNSIYNILLYFKQMYLNLKVSLQTLQSSVQKKGNFVTLRGCVAPSSGKKSLLNLLKEKIKTKPPALPPAPPSADRLKDLLNKNDLDITKLPVKDQNEIIALIDHRLMVDIRNYIKDLKVTQSPAVVNASKKVLRMVCWLFCQDHDLDPSLTDRVMDQWNSLASGHSRVVSHLKTKKTSKTHNTRMIIATYLGRKRGEEFIARGVKRLFENGCEHRNTYYTSKKISFEDVFINPFDKQIWETMLNASDRDWAIYVHNDGYKNKNHQEEISKAKEMFIHIFFTDHPERGRDFLRMHDRTFSSWIIRLINSFNMYKRHTGGLGLVLHKDDAHPSVIFEYLMWYNANRFFDGIHIGDLTSKDYWGRFISHMRLEWNDNFWKRESDIVEE